MRRRSNVLTGKVSLALLITSLTPLAAAPAGPAPQVPEGGQPPGPFPNTSLSGVNVIARGSTTFNSNVEVTGFEGQGPIPWSLNRYNRGDFAMRLAPRDPLAALTNLNQGFIDFADNSPSLAASQAWRPSPEFGVIIPTARQNGPIDWGDAEGPFFPTVALSEASSGPSYSMANGSFGAGDLDINTGKAGSGSEANFSFSAAWFPYDQGWLGGEAGTPDPTTGAARWTRPNAHATGLAAGMVRWTEFPAGGQTWGGLAELILPGVNSLTNGMLFATSSDGSSDVNIVGVAPKDDGLGWLVTIREDSAFDAETLVGGDQSEFQFVYIPYNAAGLLGGHINGADAAKIQSSGDFTITRTAVGTYELTIANKTATNGTLILQVADLEPGTSVPMASRAFLSYQFSGGKFIIQSRAATSDTAADLRDASFFVAWIDFATPVSAPDGPRLRSLAPVALTPEEVVFQEGNLAVNTDEPEVLVTTVDETNAGGYTDPITGQVANRALVGYFIDPRTLATNREPFVILGNPGGDITRHDVKYNPVSKQYVVVANARAYGPNAVGVPLIALVNPNSVAGTNSPVAKAFAYQEDTDATFDDVAVAVSSQNGNFLLAAERNFAGEGEGTIGALFDKDGNLLTPQFTRLDVLQPAGDEDDPDVVYLPGKDVFLYIANTDLSTGLVNRWVGSIIQTVTNASGGLTVTAEQTLGTSRLGNTEGHGSAIESPFNGEIISAFDLGGNNVENGDLSFVTVGPGPAYQFTQARPEIPYLVGGANGEPFEHNHPQLAVDPNSGIIAVGFQARSSTVGNPNGYVFALFGPNGEPLPSQLGTPYYLTNTPSPIGTGANVHNLKYSAASDSFIVAYTTEAGVTYVGSFQVTSGQVVDGEQPELQIEKSGQDIVISWPAPSTGFVLQQTDSLTNPNWINVGTAPTQEGGLNKVTVPTTGASTRFYRLIKP